ncbi:hypothetical protein [Neorhizobium tomejilense]
MPEISAFIDSLESDSAPRLSPTGVIALMLADAALRAVKEGKSIVIDE